MGVPIAWTRGIKDEKQKRDFLDYLFSSKPILEKLEAIINEKVNAGQQVEFDVNSYDAGYPFKQAYLNGRKALAKELLDLLNISRT